jgi:membrane-associated protease RseP (regulator of RpoE activity)
MLGTESTPYDLRFRLLDIPVRIHPLFWLVTAFLGWKDYDLPMVLLRIACVFLSILVHEYGHALMARRFHGSPSIILWGLGGLCTASGERTDGQRIAVLLAGPGAGFALGAIVMALSSLAFGITLPEHLAVLGDMVGLPGGGLAQDAINRTTSDFAASAYQYLLWINLMWGLVNLLPIWPLDGGQIFQVVMTRLNPRHGMRQSHIVSLVVAGIMAVFFLAKDPQSYFRPVLFGMLAFLNFQVLQTFQHARSFGQDHDEDWWRR